MKMPPAFSSFMRVALKGIMLFFPVSSYSCQAPLFGTNRKVPLQQGRFGMTELPWEWVIGGSYVIPIERTQEVRKLVRMMHNKRHDPVGWHQERGCLSERADGGSQL